MSIERRWKQAFEPGVDVETIPEGKYEGFSNQQRAWIKRAYQQVWGSVHCMMPVWEEDGSWHPCGSQEKINIHHILAQGFSRLAMQENPNVPRNAIPICKNHHTGFPNLPLNRMEHDAIHLDTEWARRNYATMRNESYDRVSKQRMELIREGREYWNTAWDGYFRDVAEQTFFRYIAECPDDMYPDSPTPRVRR